MNIKIFENKMLITYEISKIMKNNIFKKNLEKTYISIIFLENI